MNRTGIDVDLFGVGLSGVELTFDVQITADIGGDGFTRTLNAILA